MFWFFVFKYDVILCDGDGRTENDRSIERTIFVELTQRVNVVHCTIVAHASFLYMISLCPLHNCNTYQS